MRRATDRQEKGPGSSVLELILIGWMALALAVWVAVALGTLVMGQPVAAPAAAGYLWVALVSAGIIWGAVCLLRTRRSGE